ncbi:hypothetical protein SAMN05444921_108228 [Streptomyces wuyuanensis]|uniref:Uncharacterized protein n=1 Tax=Streptomyces wuyuanensis TaxID=1196353 RepID=A0A1G9TEH6_9ACTN|nr:hypothetical protein SAMN05444921_108228 [Streptomyces wuyuanensis]
MPGTRAGAAATRNGGSSLAPVDARVKIVHMPFIVLMVVSRTAEDRTMVSHHM